MTFDDDWETPRPAEPRREGDLMAELLGDTARERKVMDELKRRLNARKTLHQAWCGHRAVTWLVFETQSETWVASCDGCYKDENGDDADIIYYLKAKSVMNTTGLSRNLAHLTEKGWFIPTFDSFLDAVAFARAVCGGEGISPSTEGVSLRWVD
jgi:hypothetical protein